MLKVFAPGENIWVVIDYGKETGIRRGEVLGVGLVLRDGKPRTLYEIRLEEEIFTVTVDASMVFQTKKQAAARYARVLEELIVSKREEVAKWEEKLEAINTEFGNR